MAALPHRSTSVIPRSIPEVGQETMFDPTSFFMTTLTDLSVEEEKTLGTINSFINQVKKSNV